MPRTVEHHRPQRGENTVPLALRERKAVVRELSVRYQRATKRERGRLLDQLTSLTGYARSYAARALRQASRLTPGKRPLPARRPRGGRKRLYDEPLTQALTRVWAILDFPCGKRLAPFLPEIVPVLERCGELHLADSLKTRLTSISPATIDRLLAPERKKLNLKGRPATRPGSLLKHDIPIKTFADWDEARPGFVETDLVAHDGGSARGDYAQTLDVVDVATGWTETAAVKNKAQKWVFAALEQIRCRLPFPLRGLDSDNGAEFINDHLRRFCTQHGITFTRSRPYRKNDSCHVEQKNWSVVRKTVGYLRYDTPEQLTLLNELYGVLRLYTNYFQPVMKLRHKERRGARVKKVYGQAATPYQRVLLSPHVAEEAKTALKEEYARLNPAALKRQILKLQEQLLQTVRCPKTPESTQRSDPVVYISF